MAELLEYKCPACGGTLEFDSETQKMRCPYCDSEYDPETIQSSGAEEPTSDPTWETSQAGTEWSSEETEGMRVYVCNSCGGEIVTDATTVATSCPFCGNNVVMAGEMGGALRPQLIIPFKLDKEQAKTAYENHLKGKKLLPKIFKDENHIDEIKGVYVPFWVFDAEADASIRYRGTKTKAWSDRNYNYISTEYYAVLRSGTLDFEGVPVDGSSKMPDALMESIEPYDINEAIEFKTSYLPGYFADKYDVSAEDSVGRANERIKKSAEVAFRATANGYATLQMEQSSIKTENSSVRYCLYPVWLLNTTWNGQKYTFAMNGQTGKFVGDLPIDKSAYYKYFAIYGGIGAAAIFAVLTLLSSL